MRRIHSLFQTVLLPKAAAALTAAVGLLLAVPSLAQEVVGDIPEEPAGEATALGQATGGEHQGGLPQLTQTETFASQIFWTIVTFCLLYFVIAKVILPRIAGTMEERQDKLDDDLSRAEKLRLEADQVMAEHEQGLQQARSEATALLGKAQEAWQAEAAKRNAAEDAKLAEKIKADEARIVQARTEAEGNLKSVAATVATALTDKLIGVTPPEAQVTEAVDSVVQR